MNTPIVHILFFIIILGSVSCAPVVPKPTIQAQSKDTLTLNASISKGYLRATNSSDTLTPKGSHDVEMTIQINAGAIKEEKRKPVHVAFVVDTSESMQKQLPFLKKALKAAVGTLRDGDKVTLVTYHTTSEVLLSGVVAKNKDEVYRAIDALKASGSTSIEQGLNKAIAELSRETQPKVRKHMLLFSDGITSDDLGIDSKRLKALVDTTKKAFAGGISTSSFSLGKEVHLPFMASLGVNAGGRVSLFLDGLKDESIATNIIGDIRALQDYAATKVKLVVLLSKDAKLLSLEENHEKVENTITVYLEPFVPSKSQTLKLRLKLAPNQNNKQPTIETILTYLDHTQAKKNKRQSIKLIMSRAQ